MVLLQQTWWPVILKFSLLVLKVASKSCGIFILPICDKFMRSNNEFWTCKPWFFFHKNYFDIIYIYLNYRNLMKQTHFHEKNQDSMILVWSHELVIPLGWNKIENTFWDLATFNSIIILSKEIHLGCTYYFLIFSLQLQNRKQPNTEQPT